MLKPTTEILERMKQNSKEHPDGVHTRLYRYLLREEIYVQRVPEIVFQQGCINKRDGQ